MISSCRHQYMSKIATVKLYLLIVRFVSFRTFNHPIIGSSNPINASGNDFHKYLCSADESGTEGVINGSFCMQRWSLFSCPTSRFGTFSKDCDFERPTFHKRYKYILTENSYRNQVRKMKICCSFNLIQNLLKSNFTNVICKTALEVRASFISLSQLSL